jgi:hypothetical protein
LFSSNNRLAIAWLCRSQYNRWRAASAGTMFRCNQRIVSIDPEDDTPKELSAWRRRFHASSYLIAAAPAIVDTPKLQEFFGKTGDSDHSTQVHILDRQGNLVWRTFEMPTAEEIVGILRKI